MPYTLSIPMKEIIFILWLFMTLILTFSLVGLCLCLCLFIPRDGQDNSTWMEIGHKLLDAVINNK